MHELGRGPGGRVYRKGINMTSKSIIHSINAATFERTKGWALYNVRPSENPDAQVPCDVKVTNNGPVATVQFKFEAPHVTHSLVALDAKGQVLDSWYVGLRDFDAGDCFTFHIRDVSGAPQHVRVPVEFDESLPVTGVELYGPTDFLVTSFRRKNREPQTRASNHIIAYGVLELDGVPSEDHKVMVPAGIPYYGEFDDTLSVDWRPRGSVSVEQLAATRKGWTSAMQPGEQVPRREAPTVNTGAEYMY